MNFLIGNSGRKFPETPVYIHVNISNAGIWVADVDVLYRIVTAHDSILQIPIKAAAVVWYHEIYSHIFLDYHREGDGALQDTLDLLQLEQNSHVRKALIEHQIGFPLWLKMVEGSDFMSITELNRLLRRLEFLYSHPQYGSPHTIIRVATSEEGIVPESFTIVRELDNTLVIRLPDEVDKKTVGRIAQRIRMGMKMAKRGFTKISVKKNEIVLDLGIPQFSNLTDHWRTLDVSDFPLDKQGFYRPFTNMEIIRLMSRRYTEILASLDNSRRNEFESVAVESCLSRFMPNLMEALYDPEKRSIPIVITESLRIPEAINCLRMHLERVSGVPFNETQLEYDLVTDSIHYRLEGAQINIPAGTFKNEVFLDLMLLGDFEVRVVGEYLHIEFSYNQRSVQDFMDLSEFYAVALPRIPQGNLRIFFGRQAGAIAEISYYDALLRDDNHADADRVFIISKDTISPEGYSQLVSASTNHIYRKFRGGFNEDLDPGLRDINREVSSHLDYLYENDESFRELAKKVWGQLEASGLLVDIKSGDKIVLIDEVTSGTYIYFMKFLIEMKMREAGLDIEVVFCSGAIRDPKVRGILDDIFPLFVDREHVSRYLPLSLDQPHVIRVLRNGKNKVEFALENPLVLLGSYLRSFFMFNALIERYRREGAIFGPLGIIKHVAPKAAQTTSVSLSDVSEITLRKTVPSSSPVEDGLSDQLVREMNRWLKERRGGKNGGHYFEVFYRAAQGFALTLEGEESQFSTALQLIAGQTATIMHWIEQGIDDARRFEVTEKESRMAISDRGGSYLFVGTFGVVKKEWESGYYFRGYEGVGKLAQDLLDAEGVVYDAEEFARRELMVMYMMNHGFLLVGNGLPYCTGSGEGQVSTIHDTLFLHDRIPGSRQVTSTGPGHYQGYRLDIKQVTEGEGIQWNYVYSVEDGRLVKVWGQRLEAGSWALALPGCMDSVVNLGGLRFNDISVGLTQEQAQGINPAFGDFSLERVLGGERQANGVDHSPFIGMRQKRDIWLVRHPKNGGVEVSWIKGLDAAVVTNGGNENSLVSVYKKLNEGRLKEIVANIIEAPDVMMAEVSEAVPVMGASSPVDAAKLYEQYFKPLSRLRVGESIVIGNARYHLEPGFRVRVHIEKRDSVGRDTIYALDEKKELVMDGKDSPGAQNFLRSVPALAIRNALRTLRAQEPEPGEVSSSPLFTPRRTTPSLPPDYLLGKKTARSYPLSNTLANIGGALLVLSFLLGPQALFQLLYSVPGVFLMLIWAGMAVSWMREYRLEDRGNSPSGASSPAEANGADGQRVRIRADIDLLRMQYEETGTPGLIPILVNKLMEIGERYATELAAGYLEEFIQCLERIKGEIGARIARKEEGIELLRNEIQELHKKSELARGLLAENKDAQTRRLYAYVLTRHRQKKAQLAEQQRALREYLGEAEAKLEKIEALLVTQRERGEELRTHLGHRAGFQRPMDPDLRNLRTFTYWIGRILLFLRWSGSHPEDPLRREARRQFKLLVEKIAPRSYDSATYPDVDDIGNIRLFLNTYAILTPEESWIFFANNMLYMYVFDRLCVESVQLKRELARERDTARKEDLQKREDEIEAQLQSDAQSIASSTDAIAHFVHEKEWDADAYPYTKYAFVRERDRALRRKEIAARMVSQPRLRPLREIVIRCVDFILHQNKLRSLQVHQSDLTDADIFVYLEEGDIPPLSTPDIFETVLRLREDFNRYRQEESRAHQPRDWRSIYQEILRMEIDKLTEHGPIRTEEEMLAGELAIADAERALQQQRTYAESDPDRQLEKIESLKAELEATKKHHERLTRGGLEIARLPKVTQVKGDDQIAVETHVSQEEPEILHSIQDLLVYYLERRRVQEEIENSGRPTIEEPTTRVDDLGGWVRALGILYNVAERCGRDNAEFGSLQNAQPVARYVWRQGEEKEVVLPAELLGYQHIWVWASDMKIFNRLESTEQEIILNAYRYSVMCTIMWSIYGDVTRVVLTPRRQSTQKSMPRVFSLVVKAYMKVFGIKKANHALERSLQAQIDKASNKFDMQIDMRIQFLQRLIIPSDLTSTDLVRSDVDLETRALEAERLAVAIDIYNSIVDRETIVAAREAVETGVELSLPSKRRLFGIRKFRDEELSREERRLLDRVLQGYRPKKQGTRRKKKVARAGGASSPVIAGVTHINRWPLGNLKGFDYLPWLVESDSVPTALSHPDVYQITLEGVWEQIGKVSSPVDLSERVVFYVIGTMGGFLMLFSGMGIVRYLLSAEDRWEDAILHKGRVQQASAIRKLQRRMAAGSLIDVITSDERKALSDTVIADILRSLQIIASQILHRKYSRAIEVIIRAVPLLIGKFSSHEAEIVREALLNLLVRVDAYDRLVLQVVERYLNDVSYPVIRRRAVETIVALHARGRINNLRAILLLARIIPDNNFYLYSTLETALKDLGAGKEHLIYFYGGALKSVCSATQHNAALALRQLGVDPRTLWDQSNLPEVSSSPLQDKTIAMAAGVVIGAAAGFLGVIFFSRRNTIEAKIERLIRECSRLERHLMRMHARQDDDSSSSPLKEIRQQSGKREELSRLVRDYSHFEINFPQIKNLTLRLLGIQDIAEFRPPPRLLRTMVTAAGIGSRFGGRNKALLEIDGKPIIRIILKILSRFNRRPLVVVRPGKWRDTFGIVRTGDSYTEIHALLGMYGYRSYQVEFAYQDFIKGDGMAVWAARENLREYQGDILLIWGDKAVLRLETVLWMVAIYYALGDVSLAVAAAYREKPYAPLFTDTEGYLIGSKKGTEITRGLDDIGVFIGNWQVISQVLGMLVREGRSVNEVLQSRLHLGAISEITEQTIRDFFVQQLQVSEEEFAILREENPSWQPGQMKVYSNPLDGSINRKGEFNFAQSIAGLTRAGFRAVAIPVADPLEWKGVDTMQDLALASVNRRQLGIVSSPIIREERLIREIQQGAGLSGTQ
ncbi:MAG: NTP transferase domain-containing protein, partial [Candidatus Omnitrophica bacterium]|nr:NTP transferase domain-containing protein [Candidatus Omnitrophota bacterium]